MEHQRNHWASKRLTGAFILDQAALERFIALVGNFNPAAKWRYTLSVSSGESYRTSDTKDLAKMPLHHRRERSGFQIDAESPDDALKYIILAYSYKTPWADIMVSKIDDNQASCAALSSWLEGCRTWYSWMYQIPKVPFLDGLVYLLCGLVAGLYLGAPQEQVLLGVVGIAFISGLLPFARDALFDPIVIAFGDEEVRQKSKVTARRWLFGLLVTGTIGAIITQVVTLRLTPPA